MIFPVGVATSRTGYTVGAGEDAACHDNCLTGTNSWKGGEKYMLSLSTFVSSLMARMRAEEGQAMAEYGLLLAVIAVVVVAAAIFLGSQISSVFSNVAQQI